MFYNIVIFFVAYIEGSKNALEASVPAYFPYLS